MRFVFFSVRRISHDGNKYLFDNKINPDANLSDQIKTIECGGNVILNKYLKGLWKI